MRQDAGGRIGLFEHGLEIHVISTVPEKDTQDLGICGKEGVGSLDGRIFAAVGGDVLVAALGSREIGQRLDNLELVDDVLTVVPQRSTEEQCEWKIRHPFDSSYGRTFLADPGTETANTVEGENDKGGARWAQHNECASPPGKR